MEVSSLPREPIRKVRARMKKKKMLDRLLILCAGSQFMYDYHGDNGAKFGMH